MCKSVKIFVSALATIVIFLMGTKWHSDARYFSGYDATVPLNMVIKISEGVVSQHPPGSYHLVDFTFDSTPNAAIPTLMALPGNNSRRMPTVIFLHGIAQDASFLKEIAPPFTESGFVLVCSDQLMQGRRELPEDTGILDAVLAFRQRPAKTINETRRLIDHLLVQPEIDPDRMYLVGASFGAITGSTVLAFDKRLRAGVLIYGAGNIRKMLDAPALRQGLGWKVSLLKPIARFLLNPADPIHYVQDISPTPVYFQNGEHDILICAAAAREWQEKAGEPKKIQWYDSDHIGIDQEDTRQVLKDALAWLLEQDNPLRPEEQRVYQVPEFLGNLQ